MGCDDQGCSGCAPLAQNEGAPPARAPSIVASPPDAAADAGHATTARAAAAAKSRIARAHRARTDASAPTIATIAPAPSPPATAPSAALPSPWSGRESSWWPTAAAADAGALDPYEPSEPAATAAAEPDAGVRDSGLRAVGAITGDAGVQAIAGDAGVQAVAGDAGVQGTVESVTLAREADAGTPVPDTGAEDSGFDFGFLDAPDGGVYF